MGKKFIKNNKNFKNINEFLKEFLNSDILIDSDHIIKVLNGPNKVCKMVKNDLKNSKTNTFNNFIGFCANVFCCINKNTNKENNFILKNGKYFFEQTNYEKWTNEQKIFYIIMISSLFKSEYIKETFNLELFKLGKNITEVLKKNGKLLLLFICAFENKGLFLDLMLINFPKDAKYKYLFQFQGQSFLNYFLDHNKIYDQNILKEFENNLFDYDYMNLIYPQSTKHNSCISKNKYDKLFEIIKKIIDKENTITIDEFNNSEFDELKKFILNFLNKIENEQCFKSYVNKSSDKTTAKAYLVMQIFLQTYECSNFNNEQFNDETLKSIIYEKKKNSINVKRASVLTNFYLKIITMVSIFSRILNISKKQELHMVL